MQHDAAQCNATDRAKFEDGSPLATHYAKVPEELLLELLLKLNESTTSELITLEIAPRFCDGVEMAF